MGFLEKQIKESGIPMGGSAENMTEAMNLYQRGYRQINISGDLKATETAFDRFNDIKRDPLKEPSTLEEKLKNKETAPSGNEINKWLKEGKMIHVGFLMTPGVKQAKSLAMKTNVLWVDGEHGPFGVDDVKKILRELPPEANVVVRVGSYNHPDIGEYLKAGAKGIVAPNINTGEEAEHFVRTVKDTNPDATAVAMIETARGVENADAIATTPGVDVIHLGPYDLSLSLRTPMGSDLHKQKVAEIENASRSAGVPIGGVSRSRTDSHNKLSQGYQFLTTVSDQEAVAGYYRQTVPPTLASQL